mmetsp:Transcript_99632/g.171586  ORF Transcript_99632/g.171586 Transcript_99632/m.171586 type:complete len:98 (-) Transcript_99632:288-581(-)
MVLVPGQDNLTGPTPQPSPHHLVEDTAWVMVDMGLYRLRYELTIAVDVLTVSWVRHEQRTIIQVLHNGDPISWVQRDTVDKTRMAWKWGEGRYVNGG